MPFWISLASTHSSVLSLAHGKNLARPVSRLLPLALALAYRFSCKQGSHTFTDKKLQDFSRTNVFPGPLKLKQTFNIKTNNRIGLQRTIQCTKFFISKNWQKTILKFYFCISVSKCCTLFISKLQLIHQLTRNFFPGLSRGMRTLSKLYNLLISEQSQTFAPPLPATVRSCGCH